MLTKDDWKYLEIPPSTPIKIECHQHEVYHHKPGEVHNWDCDARKTFGVCFSGLTGFG